MPGIGGNPVNQQNYGSEILKKNNNQVGLDPHSPVGYAQRDKKRKGSKQSTQGQLQKRHSPRGMTLGGSLQPSTIEALQNQPNNADLKSIRTARGASNDMNSLKATN